MALEGKKLLIHLYNAKIALTDDLYPSKAAELLLNNDREQGKRKKKKNKNSANTSQTAPGKESHRLDRVRQTDGLGPKQQHVQELDHAEYAICELGVAFSQFKELPIWDHVFAPKEFFHEVLEKQFAKVIVKFIKVDATNQMIEKPSITLNRVNCFVNTMQGVGVLMDIDIRSIVNTVLLEQTQQTDFSGEKTITTYYSAWYREVLLRQVTDGVVYSSNRDSFVNWDTTLGTKWTAEEYTNSQELRALAELLGPYGIRFIQEALSIQIGYQIQEILTTVKKNRNTLRILRTSFEDSSKMAENTQKLEDLPAFLQRLQLIGVIAEFQGLVQKALESVLENRIPYLLAPIREIHSAVTNQNAPDLETQLKLTELGSSAGLVSDLDVYLCRQLRNNLPNDGNKRYEEYENCCLMLVYTAVAIPFLAKDQESKFDPNYGSHGNNTHCIAKAINTITHALFNVHKKSPEPMDREAEISQRMIEFLALASSSLLKLGQENVHTSPNRESIYLLLGDIVKSSKVLSMDRLESCFPYVLLRNSYAEIQEKTRMTSYRR